MDGKVKEFTVRQKEMFSLYDGLYGMAEQNGAALCDGCDGEVPITCRVARFINTCSPGVFDVQDAFEADNLEFLCMAYYGVLGVLPDLEVYRAWAGRKDEPEWEFREALMESLLKLPEVSVKQVVVRNNIYCAPSQNKGKPHRSLKQRILLLGYRVARGLPMEVKAPLKRAAMKILMGNRGNP